DRPCYEVVFSDGSSLVADADHLWASHTRCDRKRDHVYNRTKSTTRRTYGSPESISRAREALSAVAVDATITIPTVIALLGGRHGQLVRTAARALPTHGQGARGAYLYAAQ